MTTFHLFETPSSNGSSLFSFFWTKIISVERGWLSEIFYFCWDLLSVFWHSRVTPLISSWFCWGGLVISKNRYLWISTGRCKFLCDRVTVSTDDSKFFSQCIKHGDKITPDRVRLKGISHWYFHRGFDVCQWYFHRGIEHSSLVVCRREKLEHFLWNRFQRKSIHIVDKVLPGPSFYRTLFVQNFRFVFGGLSYCFNRSIPRTSSQVIITPVSPVKIF
jgi:hypothetical protein